MSNPVKPGWPDSAALPFNLFGAPPASQPLSQGLASGIDLFKQFWGKMPGGAALPGFLVPTIDVEELDKRISDLRAAESWIEVNLNMLRGTIQGLEVQRNTIAAIHSFSTMAGNAMTTQPVAAAAATSLRSALPAGWPVAQAAPVSATPPPSEPPAEPPAEPPVAVAAPPEPDKHQPVAAEEPGGGMLAGMAANHWLGFMQEQFAKVAQAALAPANRGAAATGPDVAPPATRKKPARPSAKKAPRRAPTGRKSADS